MFLTGVVSTPFQNLGVVGFALEAPREHAKTMQRASLLTFKGAWCRAFNITFVIRKSFFFCVRKTELYKE